MSSESGFDPLDISRGVPHEAYARLRAETPISRTPNGTWYLARQDDVLAAMRDVETFRASFRDPGVVIPDEEMLINEIPEPRHGKVRRVVNSAVAAHRISDIGRFVNELTNQLLDELLPREEIELVGQLIMPIPNSAIGVLAGVPVADHELWAKWSDDVVLGDYPTKNRNERGEGLAGAHPEFAAYIDNQIAEHKAAAEPPNDFITRLIQTEVDGYRMSDIELRTFLAFLLISGNETTRHMVANIAHTMASRPDLYARVRADRSLVQQGHGVRRRPDREGREGRLRHRLGESRREVLGRSACVPTRPREAQRPRRLRRWAPRLSGILAGATRGPDLSRGALR
jgi:cytochrome P450